MRHEFSCWAKKQIHDKQAFVLLGDIGVGSFLDGEELIPGVINLGINEQAMISFAGGVAVSDRMVICHTISPFLLERAYEQIKLTIGYNEIKLILISPNGPFDYYKLGPTHHCVNDVILADSIVGLDIYLPGCLSLLRESFKEAEKLDSACYVRLTSRYAKYLKMQPVTNNLYMCKNDVEHSLQCNRAIIAIGEALSFVEKKKLELDFDVYTPLRIGNDDSLYFKDRYDEVIILEPYHGAVYSRLQRNNKKTKFISLQFENLHHKIIKRDMGWEVFNGFF